MGFWLGLVSACLLHMAARGEPNQTDFIQSPGASPAPTGFTWCPACQAMFKGETCPGCAPNPVNERMLP
jgi:hypothetical protein